MNGREKGMKDEKDGKERKIICIEINK